MKNRIFIIENIEYPFDEGGKKAGIELAKFFLSKFPESYFATKSKLSGCKKFLKLPENSPLWTIRFFLTLARLKPDMVFYLPKGSVTVPCLLRVRFIKIFCGNKTKILLLNNQPRHYPKLVEWLRFLNTPDLIITQSMSSFNNIRKAGGNVRYIPNGVNTLIFRPVSGEKKISIRKKYGFSPKDKIILHVGHINKNRNIHELTKLHLSGYKLLVVGSTSTRQDNEYRSMLENAGVKIISYLIQDIQEIYQLADCYIFPVRNQIGAIESPLSVLEAMACNLPIVSTKFGSLTSMFSQGGGFFFYQSEDELQKKISEALTVKVNTRNLVSSYSWSNICDNFSDVIEGI